MQPEYQGRDARLALMDRQGLESILIFPTIAVTVEHFMRDDAEQMYGNLRAFNTWLDETWGFAHRDRIFAPPLISLLDRERAVQELEWALRRGARAICLRPGPAYGRSPADPYFDPFWARVDEAGAVVGYHITESGYNEMMSVHFGEEPNPPSHGQSALQWSCFYGDRPIMDTVAALVFGNLFGRFPRVRVVSVENGSLWVPYLMRVMDKMGGMARNGPWIGGRIREKPSEIVRRHVFVAPHHFGEDLLELARVLGPSQILFGSDFPHGEGLPEPLEFVQRLDGLPPDQVRMIMRDNARGLLGAPA
jgi:predicted TIM-barrel fold metal-dependent hydrolase